jgi:hypothetical protein
LNERLLLFFVSMGVIMGMCMRTSRRPVARQVRVTDRSALMNTAKNLNEKTPRRFTTRPPADTIIKRSFSREEHKQRTMHRMNVWWRVYPRYCLQENAE